MTPESVVDIFREAFGLVVILVGIIVLPGLLMGLVVAVFQAATSIQEQTLTFLPRLLVTFLTLMFLGHWFLLKLTDYTESLLIGIPQMIG